MMQKRTERNRRKSSKVKIKMLALCMALVFLTLTTLTGCSGNDMELIRALAAADYNAIYSYEMDSNFGMTMSMDMTSSSNDYYDYMRSFRMIQAVLDGASVSSHLKVSSSKDLSSVRQEVKIVPSIFGGKLIDLTTGFWMDVDVNKPEEMSFVVKMPPVAAAASTYTMGKEFLTFDFGELPQTGVDMSKLFGNMEEINTGVEALNRVLNECMIKLAESMNTKTSYVQYIRPATDENGRSTKIYHVLITDAGFKDMIRSFANDIDAKTMKSGTKQVLQAIVDYVETFRESSPIYESILDELEWIIEDYDTLFDEYYETFIDSVNEMLETFQKVEFIGKNGIVLDIEVSQEGHVIGFDGKVDICIDIKGITKALGERNTEDIQKINLGFEFTNKMTRINHGVVIEMPTLTKGNSISLGDIIKKEEAKYSRADMYSNYGMYEDYGYDIEVYDAELPMPLTETAAAISEVEFVLDEEVEETTAVEVSDD